MVGHTERPERVVQGIRQAGGVEERYELVDLDIEREVGITARFADGHVATFTVGELRLACPCATCRDLRDRGKTPWPLADGATTLSISDARFHGASTSRGTTVTQPGSARSRSCVDGPTPISAGESQLHLDEDAFAGALLGRFDNRFV